MFLHRGHENHFGEGEVLGGEGSENRVWIFHGINGLFQQIVILVQVAMHRMGQACQLGENHRSPLLLVGNHTATLQSLHVGHEVIHLNPLVCL